MKKFFGNLFQNVLANFVTLGLIFGAFMIFGLLGLVAELFKSDGIDDNSVLEITLNQRITESAMDEERSPFDFEKKQKTHLIDILKAIEHAKDDDKVNGISLKLKDFKGGLTQLEDIREQLQDFKESGKYIYAYSNNSSQGAYYLNTVADSIFQNPLGVNLLQGLATEIMFFKNFGDKYGVDFQVTRYGQFKSAAEPYLREDMSEQNRFQLTELLNDIWGVWNTNITTSRGISDDQLQAAVDSLHGFNAEKGFKSKLYDVLAHESEYDEFIAKKMGLEPEEDETYYDLLPEKLVSLGKYLEKSKIKEKGERVAVIYASGAIMDGSGTEGIFAENYKKAIRKVANDEDIKAVVFRVNSPGGSADASEEILFELLKLKEKKPLIVSMGDVAASGGYYVSMAADSLLAQPNTITGSIGVLGMVPNAKELLNGWGLTTDYVKTHENALFFKSFTQPLTESGKQQFADFVDMTYRKFVSRVMDNREMNFEQVDSLGQGRVWSGKQAKKVGLIDGFGSLQDAIDIAAKKAGLDEYKVESYPKRKEPFQEFLESLGLDATQQSLKAQMGEENYHLFMKVKQMQEAKTPQYMMPFELKIDF